MYLVIILIIPFEFEHDPNTTECYDAMTMPVHRNLPYAICERSRFPYDHSSKYAQSDAIYEVSPLHRRDWHVSHPCRNPLVLAKGRNVPVYHRLSPAIQLTITVNNEEHHYRYALYC